MTIEREIAVNALVLNIASRNQIMSRHHGRKQRSRRSNCALLSAKGATLVLGARRIKFDNELAIPADSFARAVAFAMSQPEDVDVNEILFRPTRQDL